MLGPPKQSSPSSDEPENILVRVQRLRQQSEAFQRTVEKDLRTARAFLEELRVRQAKGRPRSNRWLAAPASQRPKERSGAGSGPCYAMTTPPSRRYRAFRSSASSSASARVAQRRPYRNSPSRETCTSTPHPP